MGWVCKQHMVYLGGTDKADIFTYENDLSDLRLVWGEGAQRWHWATYRGDRFKLDKLDADGLDDPPTEEELQLAWTYIQLFAPHVAAAAKGERIGASV